jgi:hypothetical protein
VLTPDHSILGRFITRHEEASGALFASVTEAVLKRTNSGRARVAGDGTVLEAMSSRALVKCEALNGVSAPKARRNMRRSCAHAALDRPNAKAVVVGEPEAGLLKLKNGRGIRPAYQAAVLVNEARVVLDAQVHSTSEQAALAEPLERLDGAQTRELLLDAGFNSYAVLEWRLKSPAKSPRSVSQPCSVPSHSESPPCLSSNSRTSISLTRRAAPWPSRMSAWR